MRSSSALLLCTLLLTSCDDTEPVFGGSGGGGARPASPSGAAGSSGQGGAAGTSQGGSSATGGAASYTPSRVFRATIRRAAHNVPHVTADDLAGLGYGQGYAGAQDFACVLADQLVKVRGERARYFGRGKGSANVDSDLAYRQLDLVTRARDAWPALSSDTRDLVEGFAAGFNRYVAERGKGALPDACRDAPWVTTVTTEDLVAYYLHLSLYASSIPLLAYLPEASPPESLSAKPRPASQRPFSWRLPPIGSNGWAVGRDRSANGRGLLVANPHFPWEGELRLYERRLTIPGQLDVHGVGLTGVPLVLIGFNRDVAFTHTVTSAMHFTAYKLALADGDPTSYVVDGKPRKMSSREISVQITNDDGSVETETRTLYRSHLGPMISGVGLGWSKAQAFTYRDANEGNLGMLDNWLAMARATSVEGIRQAAIDHHGIPWVNTIAADTHGSAMVLDSSRVPRLGAASVEAFKAALAGNGIEALLWANRVTLLDGSTSRDEWVEGDDPRSPGLVPVVDAPQLIRADFAMNANDPAWLTNPASPITGYSHLYGPEREPPSPRTRMNLLMLTEQREGGASGPDGKFDLDELTAAVVSNRVLMGHLLRDQVAARCSGVAEISAKGQKVSLVEACDALASWDGKVDLDSKGALVMRELVGSFERPQIVDKGPLFDDAFDPDDPLAHPSQLAPPPASGDDPVLVALAEATLRLARAGLTPGSTLRDAQYTLKSATRIAVHGGNENEGATNVVGYSDMNSTLLEHTAQPARVNPRTDLTEQGYVINYGTSFVMALAFTDEGPRARALLTYSQSADPASPYSSDQTLLYADKAFRDISLDDGSLTMPHPLSLITIETGGGLP